MVESGEGERRTRRLIALKAQPDTQVVATLSETIIDAHHHIWRAARVPWLSGPMQPRIFGEYSAIRRDYTIGDYMADAQPHGVVKSVFVPA